MEKFDTPVLFIIFNRPETTRKVFEKIREIRPSKLYVAADGPRAQREGEQKNCEEVRSIATDIDWDCKLHTLFQDNNLGCGVGPVTGINWFFEQEEYGIILEDDCKPSDSFFKFCEELLHKYRYDDRIMHINGNNYGASEGDFTESDYSYHFGQMPQVWGWASWRRAWEHFDWEIANLDQFRKFEVIKKVIPNKLHKEKLLRRWNLVIGGKRDIWDFQWQFSVISNNGLTIVPKQNLISNIGFGEDATHTISEDNAVARLDAGKMSFPLTHPKFVVPDSKIDFWYQKNMLGETSFLQRVKNKLALILGL